MKPWLLLSPEMAHALSPYALQVMSALREPMAYQWQPLKWKGLYFANRLGIAGGLDKDGDQIEDWWTFGPGFIEVGTVTPLAQEANDGRIMDRDNENRALWNRMGFPGRGVEYLRENLRNLPSKRTTPLFINIGKNRTTANEDATADYAVCIERLAGLADAFVVNVSSPNTSGLRELLLPANLERFLQGVLTARNNSAAPFTPVLLKLSPDLNDDDLANAVNVSVAMGLDGFVATNTTLARDSRLRFPEQGGVSGAPLAAQSKLILQKLVGLLGSSRPDKLIVSVGGVMSADDVMERLSLGADLVQVYTALIFEGPGFFKAVAQAASRPT